MFEMDPYSSSPNPWDSALNSPPSGRGMFDQMMGDFYARAPRSAQEEFNRKVVGPWGVGIIDPAWEYPVRGSTLGTLQGT